jgi:hypothetical protein
MTEFFSMFTRSLPLHGQTMPDIKPSFGLGGVGYVQRNVD